MSQGELKVTTYLVCVNPMLKAGLGHILANTRYEVQDQDEPVSRAGDGYCHSDCIMFIVDSNLKDAIQPSSISALKERHPEARVVILADTFSLEQMIEALIRYLDLVMLGETAYPSAHFLSAVLDAQSRSVADIVRPADALTRRSLARASDTRMLSNREAEILQCLMHGAPNKIIARQLDVAEATVKVHVKAILRKIQVANRTQAAMWAVEHLASTGGDEVGVALR
jgi:two-component system nitrate/nitrite response regulator NarL